MWVVRVKYELEISLFPESAVLLVGGCRFCIQSRVFISRKIGSE